MTKAQYLAHRAHDSIQHVRKYTGEPYKVHTDEVGDLGAKMLASYLSLTELTEVVDGFYLHDYREDVIPALQKAGRLEELAAFEAEYNALPELTRGVVDDLTDVFTPEAYPDWNRERRHHGERERLGTIRPVSKSGKLLDLFSNTRSIVKGDPDFARVYLVEKLLLLPFLRDAVNPDIFTLVHFQLENAIESLGMKVALVPK